MTEYVRVCPKCAEFEPEYEVTCSHCGHFLGAEAVVPRPAKAPDQPAAQESKPAPPPEPASQTSEQVSGQAKATAVLYLELPNNGEVLAANSGDIIGQSHESSTAQLQIPTEIPGSQFVHRYHCRVEQSQSLNEQGNSSISWWITPLSQASQGSEFTNPTSINQQKVNPDRKVMVKDGDIISLSGIQLKVCIIE